MVEAVFLLRSWKSVLFRALLTLLFGIVLLVWPGATTLALLIVFGVFVLADGIISVIQSIMAARDKEKWGLMLFKGLLEVFIGVVVLARPGITLFALLFVIAAWAIAIGFTEIVAAFETPASGGVRAILGIAGVLAVMLGLLLIIFPASAVFTIILMVGIYSIIVGVLRILLSFMLRDWQKDIAAGQEV